MPEGYHSRPPPASPPHERYRPGVAASYRLDAYRRARPRSRRHGVSHLGTAAALPQGLARRPRPADHGASPGVGLHVCVRVPAPARRSRPGARRAARPDHALAAVRERDAHQRQLGHVRVWHRCQPCRGDQPRLLHQSARQRAARRADPVGAAQCHAVDGGRDRLRGCRLADVDGRPSAVDLADAGVLVRPVRPGPQGHPGRRAPRLRRRNAAAGADRHRLHRCGASSPAAASLRPAASACTRC